MFASNGAEEIGMTIACSPRFLTVKCSLPHWHRKGREFRRQRELTASMGVAANKLLSKIASDHGKPDGLVVFETAMKYLHARETVTV